MGVQARRRRPGRDARARARRAAGRRSRPARGRARPRQDADRADARRGARRHLQPRPVHARPRPRRPRRHAHLAARPRRVRHRARPGLRQPPAGRRDQPRAGQGPVRAARGHAGAPGHDRRRRPTRCRARSSCSRPRTRSSPRARTRCPRRRSTASCFKLIVDYPEVEDEVAVVARSRPAPERRARCCAARTCCATARPCARSTSTGSSRPTRSTSPTRRATRPRYGLQRHRAAHRVRGEPARVDRPGPGRPGAGAAARPHPRDRRRRPRPRPRRPAPPARALLRRARRRRRRPRTLSTACSTSCPARRGAARRPRERGPGHRPPRAPGPGPPAGGDAVARLDLALRRRASGVLPGDHLAAGVGAGTELAQLRPYEPGDDVRRLDPAASARTGTPHVRLQVPERAMTTWLVLDVSPSMAFGTADRLKSDVTEGVGGSSPGSRSAAAGRVSLLTGGTGQVRRCRRAAGAARSAPCAGARPGRRPGRARADGRRPRRGAPARARMARQRGLVVVVSDFRDDGWARPLRALAARHPVVAVEVIDPRESALPDAGHLVLVDPEDGREVEVDTDSAQLRETYAARRGRAPRGAAPDAAARRRPARRAATRSTDWLRDLGKGLR